MTELNRSTQPSADRTHLRYDGVQALLRARAMHVHLTIPAALPAGVDAIVHEQDTSGVLVENGELRPVTGSYRSVIADMLSQRPQIAGSVVIHEGTPLELYAIVHDLATDPSWRGDWIENAIALVLATARERRLRSLAMPPLGAVHGRYPVEQFVGALRRALDHAPVPTLTDVWLLAPTRLLAAVYGAVVATRQTSHD